MSENSLDFHGVKEAVSVLKQAILESQQRAALNSNRELLSLYYGIGRYVSENSRQGFWGTGAIEAISSQLKREMPGLKGFSPRSIKNMRQFFEIWSPYINRQPLAANLPDSAQIIKSDVLVATNRQPWAAEINPQEFLGIGFSHHIEILNKTKNLEERLFYIHLAYTAHWNKYILREHLKAGDFHHTGKLPNNFLATIPQTKQAINTLMSFKDEYLLDFINVEELDAGDADDVDERVIENAIVEHIKDFILTFGHDFIFIGNQYQLDAVGRELFVDLLFFNRELNALVAVELKTGDFKPAYLGQLHLYLQTLDDTVRKPHENPSVGIVLCKSAERAFVEYAVRDYNKPMGVATYKTADEMPEKIKRALPDIDALRKELEKKITARNQQEGLSDDE